MVGRESAALPVSTPGGMIPSPSMRSRELCIEPRLQLAFPKWHSGRRTPRLLGGQKDLGADAIIQADEGMVKSLQREDVEILLSYSRRSHELA